MRTTIQRWGLGRRLCCLAVQCELLDIMSRMRFFLIFAARFLIMPFHVPGSHHCASVGLNVSPRAHTYLHGIYCCVLKPFRCFTAESNADRFLARISTDVRPSALSANTQDCVVAGLEYFGMLATLYTSHPSKG